MADLSRIIAPSLTEMEALKAAVERIGHLARNAANSLVEAFALAARQQELNRLNRAKVHRMAQWRNQLEKAALRRQFDRDPSSFGRKRRWRRARGRRIEAKQNPPYAGGRIWLASANPIDSVTRICNVQILDCVDGFF